MAAIEASDNVPSPFPAWMRAADPRLAAAETNGLYRAFRSRRRVQVLGPVATAVRVVVFAVAAFGAAAMGYGWWVCVAAVPLGAAKALLAGLRAPWAKCRLPESLTATLEDPCAVHPQVAADIALLPASTEETLECVYLERREWQAWAIRDGIAFGAALVAGIYVDWLDFGQLRPALLLAPVAAFLFLAWCVSRAMRGFFGAAYVVLFVCRPLGWRKLKGPAPPAVRYVQLIFWVAQLAGGMGAAMLLLLMAISIVVDAAELPYDPGFAWLATGLQVAVGMVLLQFFARPGAASPELLPLVPGRGAHFADLAELIVKRDMA